MTALAHSTFTAPCPCGLTASFIDGVEVPHEHATITPQMVRDAWADGYDAGKARVAS